MINTIMSLLWPRRSQIELPAFTNQTDIPARPLPAGPIPARPLPAGPSRRRRSATYDIDIRMPRGDSSTLPGTLHLSTRTRLRREARYDGINGGLLHIIVCCHPVGPCTFFYSISKCDSNIRSLDIIGSNDFYI